MQLLRYFCPCLGNFWTNFKYLTSLDYVQVHTLSDIRLALGYIAVIAVAGAAFYEYKVGFKEAKGVSMLGVGIYFILNIALYFWGYFIEGDIVYVGKKGDITVYSTL